ncbi:hypothetical protein N7523_008696 [Penicillium sp. IBT 18751x]|nr:hypothetical protein N7523_008696 [Penicillium sp. IBT 18751x]
MQIDETRFNSQLSSSAPPTLPHVTRLVSHTYQRPYQIHYGASSNISLLNHLYQSFNPLFGGDFLLRRLNYFSESLGQDGAEIVETNVTSDVSNKMIVPTNQLPFSIASEILEHFVAVHRLLIPIQSPEVVRSDLRAFYGLEPSSELSNIRRRALILVLAIASLTTIHHSFADILISQFNESTTPADDNLTTMDFQLVCTEIRRRGQGQIRKWRNKEILLGFFTISKISIHLCHVFNDIQSWICVHLGRPSSFTAVDLIVPPPKDPFLSAVVRLSDIMRKCSNEIYIPTKGSLLPMWTSAVSIMSELHEYEDKILATLGFGLHYRSELGDRDAQQTILTTLYLHTIILVFRPFVIFSGKLKSQQTSSDLSDEKPRSNPPWLEKACSYALGATRRLIDYICLAMSSNQVVKVWRYVARMKLIKSRFDDFFFHIEYALQSQNCCAVLSYEILHDYKKASSNIPFIAKSIDCLSQMRPGDSIQRIITSFENLLCGIQSDIESNDRRLNEELFVNMHVTDTANNAPPNMHGPFPWTQMREDIEGLEEVMHHIIS